MTSYVASLLKQKYFFISLSVGTTPVDGASYACLQAEDDRRGGCVFVG